MRAVFRLLGWKASKYLLLGEALAVASGAEPEATGQAMAYSAEEDPESTGDALAVAVRFDPEAIGQAFISALKLRAEAIAEAIKVAAKKDAGGIQIALQTGPAQDPEAREILARVLPSISWVPQLPPQPGPDPAGDGVVLEAILTPGGDDAGQGGVSFSPVERVLIKFPENRPTPILRIEVLSSQPADVPDFPPDRIVSDYISITAENFTDDDLVVAQVTLAVQRSWMEANDIHEWSIEFTRYDEESGRWKPALANRIGDEGDRILYSLVVTEFSLWSITGSTDAPPVIFQLDNLDIQPSSVSQGDSAVVSATVNNLLDQPAEYVAVLWVNGAMNASRTFELAPNKSTTVRFEISPDEGVYEVRIDRLSGTLIVVASEETSYLLWTVIGAAAILISISTLFVWRRRMKGNGRQGAFD